MDLQFWIWLIVIVVTFLARAKKKKPYDEPTAPEQWTNRPSESPKPISFEDLLREIQSSKVPSSAEKKKDYVDYDDDLEVEAVEEKVDYKQRDQDKTFETYEKAKQEAFNRPSLEETMRVEDTVVKFGQFKNYQQDNQAIPVLSMIKDLQDPEGFKKAFILSEILTRKF